MDFLWLSFLIYLDQQHYAVFLATSPQVHTQPAVSDLLLKPHRRASLGSIALPPFYYIMEIK